MSARLGPTVIKVDNADPYLRALEGAGGGEDRHGLGGDRGQVGGPLPVGGA